MKKIFNKVWVSLFIVFCMFNVATYLIVKPNLVSDLTIFNFIFFISGIALFHAALLVLIDVILDLMLSRYKNKIKKNLKCYKE